MENGTGRHSDGRTGPRPRAWVGPGLLIACTWAWSLGTGSDSDAASTHASEGPRSGSAGRHAFVAPPPSRGEPASWSSLAAWAADGYAALGFAFAPERVMVDVLERPDPAVLLDHAARELALEVLEVGPRTNAETRWILRRALGRASEASPEAQLAEEVGDMIHSTPLWFDRRTGDVRVVGAHPFFGEDRERTTSWEPWHLMAHEVAHALQDRREPLREAQGKSGTYEEHVVRKCLYEGEADLMMLALAVAVRGEDLREIGIEPARAELARLFERAEPSYYDAGSRYLLQALMEGGWEAVERAVTAPGVSSRELLAGPEASAEQLTPITLPPWWPDVRRNAEYVWDDEVGAWGLLGILAADYPERADLEELQELALAWRGDRLSVARRTDGVAVLMWRITLADAASAERLTRHFAGADGTVSCRGATLDFAWSPVASYELQALGELERLP